jgi:hypothetical protein
VHVPLMGSARMPLQPPSGCGQRPGQITTWSDKN